MPINKLFPGIHGAWSWHSRPSAVRYVGTKDQTYWTQVATDGNLYLCSYNHGTDEYLKSILTNSITANDHNNASVLVVDGYILVAFCNHNGSTLYCRKSDNVEDITALTTTATITAKATYSYAQLIELSDEGRILLFTRRPWQTSDGGSGDGIATTEKVWDILISDDDGDTFAHHSVPLCFESDGTVNAPYTEPYGNGKDTIWFARSDWMSGGGSDARQDIIFFKYKSNGTGSGSFYKADDTLICAWSALPIIDKTDLETIYDTSAETGTPGTYAKDIIADDTSGDIAIVFTLMDTTTEVNTYYYARWDDSAQEWTIDDIVEAGYDFTTSSAQPAYEGGIVIDPDNIDEVVISREQTTGGGHWEIERWATDDEGATWAKDESITSGDTSLPDKCVRPMIPRNYHADFPVMWMGGVYADYDDFATWAYAISPEFAPAFTYPSSAFVADSITDLDDTLLTSHTGELGATWTRHISYTTNIPIFDCMLAPTAATIFLASGTQTSADYTVTANIYVNNLLDSRTGVGGRFVNSATKAGYFARIYTTANKVQLYKYYNNTATLLEEAAFTPVVGETYKLTLDISDDAKEVWIDDVLYITDSDNQVTATGLAAVYIGGNPTTGLLIQDFIAAGDTILPINVTGSCSFSGEVTRKVLYNRSVEGEI